LETATITSHRPLNVSGTQLSCLLLMFLTLPFGQPASAQTATVLPCLTNAQQIRGLDPAEAQKGFPVRVRGIVTFYDAPLFNLFLQDGTAGIFVLMQPNMKTTVAAGQEIELEGTSDKGDFAPIVKVSTIRVLGKGQLPVPRRVSIDQLFTGLEDSLWIEVSGVVRSETVLEGRHYLTLALNGQRIMTYIEDLQDADAEKLINTTVRVRGVCYSRYNARRQLRVPWLAVSSLGDVVVERPSPEPPKELSIASLAQFNSGGYYGNRVKVSGVVTLQKPDGTLYIQNQGCGLCVEVAQPANLAPGDRVVVLGYSALGQYVPILEDATVQPLGHGERPLPIPTNLESLQNSPEDFEGVFVNLKASLINLVDSDEGHTLVLRSSNSIFTANIEGSQADNRFKSLNIGSQLALTGVFVAQSPRNWVPGIWLPHLPPESIQLLLRSYDDIAVIRQPPWWTLPRLLWTLGIMTLILLAGLAWVVVLDRRVRQQTLIIQQKSKQGGVLEERNRIAREFHDTLEQELAAITIQLDAVEALFRESPQIARRQLELARNMSRRSLSEARRSVWDLRSHLLENSNLITALREMATPISLGSGIEIAVESSGKAAKLPVITEHNLLRIAQEALTNAFKHSRAKKIVVTLNYETKQIQLGIRDDGSGFDMQTAGFVNGGHFGLLDMQERAEKIGGRFSINSKAAGGTEVIVTIATITGPTQHSPNHDHLTTPAKDSAGSTVEP
jgi:signal transduction histidine kinase